MATAGLIDVVLDTSVLVNFLRLNREDLLAAHPGYRFILTDNVRKEITDADQLQRVTLAIAAGRFHEATATSVDEVALFAQLSTRLGAGESAAIAVAAQRGLLVALDDRAAKKQATLHCSGANVLDTVDIVVSLIHAGILTVAEADAMKSDWETSHRFTLKFQSFGERI